MKKTCGLGCHGALVVLRGSARGKREEEEEEEGEEGCFPSPTWKCFQSLWMCQLQHSFLHLWPRLMFTSLLRIRKASLLSALMCTLLSNLSLFEISCYISNDIIL